MEQAIQTADDGLVGLVASCDAHKIAGAIKHTLHIVDSAVSGVIHTSLATGGAGSTGKLQAILQEIFAAELEIVLDYPPKHCTEYLNEVLELFCPLNAEPAESRQNTRRQYVLRRMCNSDISQRRIVHFCPHGCCPSPQSTHAIFAQHVTWAMIPKRPSLLQRKSWTGADLSFQSVGLLQNMWGLLGRVVSKYTGRPHGPLPAADTANGALENMSPDPGAEVSWTTLNQQYAQQANAFASGHIDAELFSSVLLVLGPAMSLLREQLLFGSSEWERQQQYEATQGRPRTFPAVEKATGSLLSRCFGRIFEVFLSLPKGIPLASYVRRARSLLFRLLSALVSVLHFNMRRFERVFPWQLFSLLHSTRPGCMDALYSLPECLRDPVADAFFGLYPTKEDLSAAVPDALALLELLACMTQTDISSVEAGHASTRELCMARSRGHVPTVQQVAASAFFRFVRKNYTTADADEATTTTPEDEESAQQGQKRKRQVRAQGAWRAFLHRRLKGQAFGAQRMQDLAAEHKALPFDEWMEFYELGCASSLSPPEPGSALVHHARAHGESCKDLALSACYSMADYEAFLMLDKQERRELARHRKATAEAMESALAAPPQDSSIAEAFHDAAARGFMGAADMLPSASRVHHHTWKPPAGDFCNVAWIPVMKPPFARRLLRKL